MKNPKARGRLEGWGLSIAPDTIDLVARTLPPEPLLFGNNVKIPGKPNAEWNNEVTKNAVITAVDIRNWVLVYTERDSACSQASVVQDRRSCFCVQHSRVFWDKKAHMLFEIHIKK